MDGAAIVALGFIAFGCLHIETASFRPWQWLNIVFGLATLVVSVLFWWASFFCLGHALVEQRLYLRQVSVPG